MTWYSWGTDENNALESVDYGVFDTLVEAQEADPGLVNYKLYKFEVTEVK